MKKINFTNATVTAQASVEINGESHDVTPAVIEGGTLPTPDNMNQLQNNVEEAILNPVVESIKSKNLVNEIITGYTLNGSGGVSATSTQFVTGFMEVEGGKTYTSQGFKGANGVENNYKDWYTADKTFISNTNDKTATAPSNAIFCRMNGAISTSSNMQLEEGNTATEFTHYKSFGYTSGSNENGSWVKYDDGRMECTKTLSTYADATSQWGSMYETFEAVPLGNTPQNFVGDLPKVIVTIHDNDWFIESVREVQLNSFGNMRLALPISATNRKLAADIVAYGRWK